MGEQMLVARRDHGGTGTNPYLGPGAGILVDLFDQGGDSIWYRTAS